MPYIKLGTMQFDLTPPTGSITAPLPAPWYTSTTPVSFAGTAEDLESGIMKVEWSLDNASWTLCTGTTSWSANVSGFVGGNNTVYIRITNNAVLTTTLSETVVYDTSPPAISFSSPIASGGTFYTTGSTVNISGSASDAQSGITNVAYSLNSAGYITCSGTTSWSANSLSLISGSNSIVARATNGTGATTTTSIAVVRDNTPPSGSITSPAAEPYNTSTASNTVSGTASDNYGVASVTYALSGATTGSGTCSGTTSWSTGSRTYNQGTTVCTITVTDLAGLTFQMTRTIVYNPGFLQAIYVTTQGLSDDPRGRCWGYVNFNSNQLTLEFRFKFQQASKTAYACAFSNNIAFLQTSNSYISLHNVNSSSNIRTNIMGVWAYNDFAFTLDTWYWFAATRNASNLVTTFINGTAMTSTFTSASALTCNGMEVFGYYGAPGGSGFYQACNAGFTIDEIRLSNVNRYPSNYTVPTAPFLPGDGNTTLILHCNNSMANAEVPYDGFNVGVWDAYI